MDNTNQKRFHQILTMSPAIVYACRVEDLKATFVSDNITTKFGYTIKECLDSPGFWIDNLHPDDRDRILASHDKVFTEGHNLQEYRFRKKSGEYVWIHDEVRLVTDTSGNPAEIIGSWLEITDRKKSEDLLKSSERLFRELFDSNPIPTIITDTAGVVFKVNPAFTVTTGYTSEDVVGRTSQEMGFWRNIADRERMVAAVQKQGAIDNLEAQFFGKDNKPMTCVVSSRAVEHDGELRMLSTVIDVTDQRRAEEEKRRNEKLFRVFFDDNPVPAIISTTDGIVKEVNEAFLLSSGFSRRDVEGRSSLDLFWSSSEDRNLMLAALKEQGYVDNLEFVFSDKNKASRTCLLSCRQIQVEGDVRILNIIVDITEKRKAEEAKRKSDALFRSLFEISPVGSIVTSPEGEIHLANPTFVKASGYKYEQLVGKTVQELGFWQNEEDRSNMLNAVLEHGFLDNFEAVLYGNHKKKKTCMVSSRAIELEGETRILSLVVDVTAQRAAEKSMRDLEQAKSDFISTAAHELRTPLIAVIGYCELLENSVGLGLTDQQKSEFLEVILTNAEILNRLVDDLLDIGRIQIGRSLGISRKETALTPLIDKVVATSCLKSDRHEIIVEYREGLPQAVWMDPGRITQVLNNLLSNAIKFSPSGGKVMVRLERCVDHVDVSVVDSGIGMSDDQVEHIFDRFYRVDKESSESLGLGLGLSIVKQIIIDHGGDINVESKPGKGTTVKFSLPFRS